MRPFEFAKIGLDNVIQVFDLSMRCRRWAGAFLFQGGNSGALGRGLIDIEHMRVYPSVHPVHLFLPTRMFDFAVDDKIIQFQCAGIRLHLQFDRMGTGGELI